MSRSRLPAVLFFLVCTGCALALAQGQQQCSDLVSCVSQGVDTGLRRLQDTSVFPLLGRHLILERRDDLPQGQPGDLGQGSVFERASRLLDTHSVRAPVYKDLSLRLFKSPQGPFDISLDVAPSHTDAQGRTFFKRRLQMALLPIMYKLGVMTTLLGVLVVMVAKGLTIGVILLILGVSSAVKQKLLWSGGHGHHGGGHVEVGHSAAGWAPAPQQGVHLHLHGLNKEHIGASTGYGHSGSGYSRSDYVGPYNQEAHFGTSGQQQMMRA